MSVSTSTDTGKGTNLFTAFERTVKRLPDHIAFKAEGGRGKTYTYQETRDLAARVASGLGSSEFTDIAEIGLLSENRPEWCIAYLSILAAGKTVVPIDINLKEQEIGFIINHTGMKAVFCSGKFEQLLRTSFPQIRCFSFDESSEQSWKKLMSSDSDLPNDPVMRPAALIYTSGTTGEPKGVELTHRNLLANLEGIEASLRFNEQDTFLSILPLHHTFEATCGFLTPLISGSTIVYGRSLKSRDILEDIAYNEVTLMCGVPLLYEKMYQSIKRGIDAVPAPKRLVFSTLLAISSVGWKLGKRWGTLLFAGFRAQIGLGTIRMFVSGGAPLPAQISRFFNLVGFSFQQGYGMTECSPVISVNRPDNIKFDSVGPPLENLQVRIFEPNEQGVGEIIVKGDSITPGYRNNPERTAELIRDGWLHTGDIGKFEKGHLWITGRQKNIIVSAAGKNIYPEQIEEKLLESRYILEAVVFGQKKKGKTGEEVCSVIVPDMDQVRTEFPHVPAQPDHPEMRDLIKAEVDHVNNQISDYKRISRFDISIEELEKTSTRKVKRHLYKSVETHPDSHGKD